MTEAPAPNHFGDALRDAVARTSPICVGIDPRPRSMPREVFAGHVPVADLDDSELARGYVRFSEALLHAARGLAAVVKPQVAFYEQLLDPGFSAFVATCRLARDAGFVTIADVKRSDIGSTAEAYADAYLAPHGRHPSLASAVTINPYLGRDGLDPFVARARCHGGGVFVLVRTSNPSASDYQDRDCGGRRLYEIVAADVARMSESSAGTSGYGFVGAVAGATRPEELAALRAQMPHAWLLVPGYGAQGAGATDVARAFDANGLGAVINASRSLNFPWGEAPAPEDWRQAIKAAMLTMRDALLRARDAR